MVWSQSAGTEPLNTGLNLKQLAGVGRQRLVMTDDDDDDDDVDDYSCQKKKHQKHYTTLCGVMFPRFYFPH